MSNRVQQAIERLRKCRLGVSLYHVYGQPISDVGHENACFEYDEDNRILADAYLAEHAPKPLESYLAFANMLCVEDAGLDYDAAVAVAKAMHKRKMVIPNE